jgi:hypothetical protein
MSRAGRPALTAAAVVAAAAVAVLAACGESAPTRTVSAGIDAPSSCVSAGGEGSAAIDWVDFVHVRGRMYTHLGPDSPTVPATAVGAAEARVLCRIADVVGDPSYRPRDGDAAFLPEGTELHRFGDAAPALRLVALVDGAWRVYEVMDDATARTGADLLDLSGGVDGIDLLDGETGQRVVATVDDPATVRRLVDAVLAAPTLASAPDDVGDPVFLRFRLADGTTITRAWHRPAGVLAMRIDVPAELDAAFPQR